jgi:TPR repeat protein
MKKGECTLYPLLDSEEEKKKLADSGTDEVNAWFQTFGNRITPEIKDKMLSGLRAGMTFLDAYESAAGIGSRVVINPNSNKDDSLKITDPVLWLAYQGDPEAQYTISLQYAWGGIANRQQNQQESFLWCKKSAENGFLFAEYQLGLKYLHGEGIVAELSEGKRWITKAYLAYFELSEKGDPDAMYMLGQIFQRCGNAVKHDLALAHMWYDLANKFGNTRESPLNLESVMSPEQITESKKREQEWLAKHPELKVKIK